MQKLVDRGLSKLAAVLNRYADRRKPAPAPNLQAVRVQPWIKADGDKTHRLNYDLNENAVVFDLGGYEGQWASDIFSKYTCQVHIFEPFRPYAEKIRERFKCNPRIQVHAYGLAKANETAKLGISGDASSVFKPGNETTSIQLVRIEDFLSERNIAFIDLVKINIEGGEYDLLEHLIANGMIGKFKNIQVQFHDFVPEAEARMKAIQQKLQLTHQLTYQYIFVWENWTLTDDHR